MSATTTVLALLAAATPAAAQPLTPAAAAGRVLASVGFAGLDKTEPFVVERELLVRAGEPLEVAALEETVQRLKNLRIFREVSVALEERADGKVVLTLTFAEKWTVLPIARFGGGGGTTFAVLGLYDINVLGRYVELGGQYEYFGGTHSGVVWFRDPRFLGQRLKLGVDLWKTQRVRSLYDPAGRLDGAYGMHRYKANGFLEQELLWWLTVGVGAEVDVDGFSEHGLDDTQLAANRSGGLTLPADGLSVIGRLEARLGRLDWDDYLVEGQTLQLRLERTSGLLGSELDFTRGVFDGRIFRRLPWHANVGLRVTGGQIDRDIPQHRFYVGGLDFKRGFLDGQFRGTRFWDVNAEVRIPSLRTSWLVLQHVAFYDVGGVGADWGEALALDEPPCMSTGLGIRFISPRVARLVIRLDYAFAFALHNEQGISFGVQQFI